MAGRKERGRIMNVFAVLAVIFYIPVMALAQLTRRYLSE